MKSLFTVLLVACIGFAANAQDTKKSNEKNTEEKKAAKSSSKKAPKPAITFKTTTIDRPEITYGADETFTFEFKNTGKTPVIVTNVATSCGCTTAEKPTEPVAPGKSSKISVKYDTKRVGPFTKTITVTTNVGEPIVLTIKGVVGPQPTTN
jgi:hypothetical protein